MRTDLASEISVAFTALSKTPCAEILVGYTLFDISGDITSFEVSESDSHESDTASFKISNLDGQYDLLAEVGSSYQWLRQNEPLWIKRGYSGVLDTVFTGYISAVRGVHYERGKENELDVQCLDKSKHLFKEKITTGRYENMSIYNILTDPVSGVLTSWAGLTTSDLAITDLTDTITSVQFVDELAMDAAYLLAQVKRNALRFRYDGKIENFTRYGSTVTADATITGTYVSFLETSWDDREVFNKVIVTGAISGTRKELAAESLQGTGSAFSYNNTWGADYTVYFTDPPVDINTIRVVITSSKGLGRWEIEWIKEDSMKIKFYAKKWFSWGMNGRYDMSADFEVYGQKINIITIYVQGTALQTSLFYEYGNRWIEEKIENPCICNTNDALQLASDILEDAKWQRYKCSLEIPDRFDIQPGDTLKIWNPSVSKYYWVYIQSLSHSYSRGRADSCTVSGYHMQTTVS